MNKTSGSADLPVSDVGGLMIELARSSSNEKEKALVGKIDQLTAELNKHKVALDRALLLKENADRKFKPIVPKLASKGSESVAVAVASDWHLEEVVLSDAVNGKNEFNLDIARKRVEKFFINIIKLVNLNRQATTIHTLILPLLGDFITGYIHEELLETNSLSPAEAVLEVMTQIKRGLKLIADEGNFDRVVLPCCVGNHGRTTAKKRVKTSNINSFEWLMYHMLDQVKPDSRFEYKIANGYHNLVKVFDYTIRFHHGDAMDYNGGIGGITIPVSKAIAGWDKETRADLDVFGHFHTRVDNPKFVSNGSLIGYSDFSVLVKASYEPPTQTFFLIEKEHGRTTTNPIFLD